MVPFYYVTDAESGKELPAEIREAKRSDFRKTVIEGWQTSWLTDYLQQEDLKKYALEIKETKELVGLGAYRSVPEGLLVYVEYIESAPNSNPTISEEKRYLGIGAVLLAFGIKLSVDYGFGGAIFLKAKTTEIREHYLRHFGAVPFSRRDPYLLLIDGEAARKLFMLYLREE